MYMTSGCSSTRRRYWASARVSMRLASAQLGRRALQLGVQRAQVVEAALLPAAQEEEVRRLVDRREVGGREAEPVELLGRGHDRVADEEHARRLGDVHRLEAQPRALGLQPHEKHGVAVAADVLDRGDAQGTHDLQHLEEGAPHQVDPQPRPRRALPEHDEVLADEDAEGRRPVEVVVAELDRHDASRMVAGSCPTAGGPEPSTTWRRIASLTSPCTDGTPLRLDGTTGHPPWQADMSGQTGSNR